MPDGPANRRPPSPARPNSPYGRGGIAAARRRRDARARRDHPGNLVQPEGRAPAGAGVADYSTLFQDSNPAWLAIVGKFQVFNSSLDHLRNASDAEVLQTATNLHSHHVAWAITIAGVGREPGDTCAADEGYETPLSIQASMTRLLRLKIRPDIIVMDSPFWHGHLAPQDCRFPIPVLIQRIAANLSMVTAVFPGLIYGEIETWVQIQDNPGWQQDYAQMRDGIEVATGIRLSFVHTDTFIYAHPNWPASLVAAQAFVHQQGMKYGMIYDNMDQTTKTTSDVQWIADAKAGIGVMESQVHAIPDTRRHRQLEPVPDPCAARDRPDDAEQPVALLPVAAAHPLSPGPAITRGHCPRSIVATR